MLRFKRENRLTSEEAVLFHRTSVGVITRLELEAERNLIVKCFIASKSPPRAITFTTHHGKRRCIFSGLEVIRILIFEAGVDEAIELDFHGNRGSGQSQQYGNRCQRGDLLHLFLL